MIRPAAVTLFAALSFTAAMPTGCASSPNQGYSFASPYNESIRTVSVPVFDNETFHRAVGVRLTEAIAKEINRSTPWIVAPADRAHTALSGVVRDTRLRDLSTNDDSGLVQELAMQLTVDFTWTDNRTGQTLVARRRFTGAGAFIPALGVGERIEVAEQGTIEDLARAIVAELRSEW